MMEKNKLNKFDEVYKNNLLTLNLFFIFLQFFFPSTIFLYFLFARIFPKIFQEPNVALISTDSLII